MESSFIQGRYPTFSSSLIKAQNIKHIRVTEKYKPSSGPVYDQNIRFHYYYDGLGRLLAYQKTYPGDRGIIDTLTWSQAFDGLNKVKEVEKLRRYQRMVAITPIDAQRQQRTISVKRGSLDWELLTTEQVKLQPIQNGEVLLISGVDAEPYQREVFMRNDQGQLISREVWIGSRLQIEERWTYAGGRLVAHEWRDLLDEQHVLRNLPLDMSLDTGTYCEGERCWRWSIVLNAEGLPKGWIFFDPETEDMEIWEFHYEYWQDR